MASQYASHPVLRVAAVDVVPAAKGFEEAFDASRNLGVQRGECVERCRTSARTLAVTLRACTTMLASKHRFDVREFTPETEVPADVIAKARRFVTFLESKGGAEVSAHVAELIGMLKNEVTVTANLWAEAQRVTVEAQSMEQTTRDRALVFHEELVAFRRALAAVVGRRHMDYQTLRYKRTAQAEETLDVVIDGASPPVSSGGDVSSNPGIAAALRLAEVAAE